MSSFLYDGKAKTLTNGYELKEVKKFSYSKSHWGIFYSFISLSDSNVYVDNMNKAIAEARGDGMVNVNFRVETCKINFIPLFNLLPMWPGCTNLTVKGDIVKIK